ncbi:sensor histidine kinase [Lyngbya sp. PCC 8106]|uniref:sensor histidine kinase n=1 Tax=Lyngbya sp. (strain PCC 8106) TaxID=313612 RepID=UPI0000EA9DBB|nr:sensor histidine kinase [Lyngbya sp. PCC 8106]EAW39081.1 Histidine Kinase [Lyngbya sp. PCC 8106]
MKDLGQSLSNQLELIVERWVKAVHHDGEIDSAKQLAYQAVKNSLPEVLAEVAKLLSRQQCGDYEQLEEKSLHHGFVRAEQGYDTAEIMREYRLLRMIILDVLHPDFRTGSVDEVLQAIKILDGVLDTIIVNSIESYIDARLNELKQMQGQLTLTNQELTRLLQVQKDNLAYLAHELKTPLNSIIGYSDLLIREQQKRLKSQDKVTATNLDSIERVLRNGRLLLKIINDALEISRYDQGGMQLNLERTNVGSLIQEIVEEGLQPQAQAKKLEIFIDIKLAPLQVLTDPLRIQQLVSNLVSNAIKYTKKGNIKVICQQLNQQEWSIIVSDTGIGISEENKVNIFASYFQVDPIKNPLESVGLGLAIVSRIVRLFQGEVQVKSTVGEGSIFTVTLPFIPENN